MFLRYICPAIIRPLEWGLVYDIPNDMLETYTQVSIVLQKMVNCKKVEMLDELSKITNTFVDSKRVEYFNFVTELANVPYATESKEYTCSTQQFNFYLSHIKQYYLQHKKEINKTIEPLEMTSLMSFEQMKFEENIEITLPKLIMEDVASYPKHIKSKDLLNEMKEKIVNNQQISVWEMNYFQKQLNLEQTVYDLAMVDLVSERYNSYFPGFMSSTIDMVVYEDYLA